MTKLLYYLVNVGKSYLVRLLFFIIIYGLLFFITIYLGYWFFITIYGFKIKCSKIDL